MAGMTQYFQKALLDHVLNIATYSFPNPVFLSLHTADLTEAGVHTNEVSTASGYSRQSLAAKMGATTLGTGISTNTGTITFGPASADWGTISYLAVEDSPGSPTGSALIYGAATTQRTINTGGSYVLTAGQLSIQFD